MSSEDQEKKIKQSTRSYLKYSGLAFQLLGIVAISFFLGQYLDNLVGFKQPFITIFLIIATFSGFMYKLYRELFNDK